MSMAADKPHTDTRECLLDLINFIQEQIERAKADPLDRVAAIDAARGVVPYLQNRLAEDKFLQTIFALTFNEQVTSANWSDWWTKLSKLGQKEFTDTVDALLDSDSGPLTILRQQLSQTSAD
jgi:hypothetical protein